MAKQDECCSHVPPELMGLVDNRSVHRMLSHAKEAIFKITVELLACAFISSIVCGNLRLMHVHDLVILE